MGSYRRRLPATPSNPPRLQGVGGKWAIQGSNPAGESDACDRASTDSGGSPETRATECATVGGHLRRLLELWRRLTPEARQAVLRAAEEHAEEE